MRGVAQRCPDPPMRNLVTMGSQHQVRKKNHKLKHRKNEIVFQGVNGFPHCPVEDRLCNFLRELINLGAYVDIIQSNIVQAQV